MNKEKKYLLENLEQGKYDIYYREKSIYRLVYEKSNKLSGILKSNEIERIKIDKMKQEWIANITHDIKTPLSSKGYAELLSEAVTLIEMKLKSMVTL